MIIKHKQEYEDGKPVCLKHSELRVGDLLIRNDFEQLNDHYRNFNCYLIKCISDTGIECVVFSKEKTFNTNIAGFLSGFWTHIKLSNT